MDLRCVRDCGAKVSPYVTFGVPEIATLPLIFDSWDNVNVSDASFKLEERVAILQILLNHDDISLFTLNTPVRGVSPLCLASWLDIPQMVRLLLESSRGMIPVNGMDNFGATPLMCTF